VIIIYMLVTSIVFIAVHLLLALLWCMFVDYVFEQRRSTDQSEVDCQVNIDTSEAEQDTSSVVR
jgi:cytoskeletal protein RodZ